MIFLVDPEIWLYFPRVNASLPIGRAGLSAHLNDLILQEDYRKWYSHHLGRDIEMLVYGHWGYPVLLFPTSMGRYYQNKDFGLIDTVREAVEAGKIKIYCIDSIDSDSWYAKHLAPSMRIHNHNWYDRMLHEELVPMIQHECQTPRLAAGGCSFGGYQALNFAFRHPEQVSHLWSMGAAFDIRQFLDGYYDDNVYFNNPPDYLPNAHNEHYYRMQIILGTSVHDFCRGANEHMSHILNQKGIQHWLDIRPWGEHDWPVWREMFAQYVNQL